MQWRTSQPRIQVRVQRSELALLLGARQTVAALRVRQWQRLALKVHRRERLATSTLRVRDRGLGKAGCAKARRRTTTTAEIRGEMASCGPTLGTSDLLPWKAAAGPVVAARFAAGPMIAARLKSRRGLLGEQGAHFVGLTQL